MTAGPLRILQFGNAHTDTTGLQCALLRAGYAPLCATVDSLEQLQLRLGEAHWDVLLLDDVQTSMSLAAATGVMQRLDRTLPIICVTSEPTVEAAVSAVREGACAYVAWSDEPALVAAIEREAQKAGARSSRAGHRRIGGQSNGDGGLTGQEMRERLRGAEATVRTLSLAIEQSPASVVITDRDGLIEFVNPRFCQITGYTRDEVLGQRPSVLKSGYTTELEYRTLWQTITSGGTWTGTFLNKKKNGDHYWEQASISPIHDEGGTITHFVAVKEDITERKWSDDALRLSESQYRLLAENATDLIARLTPQGTVLYASPACVTVLGFRPEDVVGHAIYEYWLKDDFGGSRGVSPEHLGPLGVETIVHRARHSAGHLVWLETTMRSICDATTGSVIEVQAASRDITLQRKTDLERERLAAIVESSSESIVGLSRSGMIENWNRAAASLFGYTAEEAIGQSIIVLVPSDRLDELAGVSRKIEAGESIPQFHTVRMHKDGSRLDVAMTVSPVFDAFGTIVGSAGMYHSIAGQLHTESALRKSEAQYRLLAENATDLIARVSVHGELHYASPACEALLGFEPDSVIGRSIAEFVHPDDLQSLEASADDMLRGPGIGSCVHRLRRRDGTYGWFETTIRVVRAGSSQLVVEVQTASRDITARKQNELLARALRTIEARLRTVIAHAPIMLFALDRDGILTFHDGGARFNYESDLRSAVGESIFEHYARLPRLLDVCRRGLAGETIATMLEIADAIYELWWTPERSELGEVTGGTGLAVDVTAAVHAQRDAERARAAALELAQLRADFVAAVSHELRTPLTAIIGYGEMLQARWDVLSESDRLLRLGRIVLSANRQKRLVEDLLLLSQVDEGIAPPRSAPINVAAVARAVASETRTTYNDQYVELDGADDMFAFADRERAIQILASIADNAAKYSPEGSPIFIRWTADGKNVAIRVFDTGSGIPDHGRERLFTRFGRIPGSRIRSGHVGTGLGLYLGQRLARAMDGDLILEETGAGGSVFKLVLPMALD